MRSIWLALIIIWHGKCETLTSSYILCSPCLNEYQCSRNLVVLTFLFQSSTLLPPQCFLSPSHSFSSWRTYLSQFLRVSLLETNSFGFCLISSLFLNNSFPRYRIHSWQVSFFFFQHLEKKKYSASSFWPPQLQMRNLIDYTEVMNHFSLAAFKTFFFSIFSLQNFNYNVPLCRFLWL